MGRFSRTYMTVILLPVFCFALFVLASAEDFSVKRIGNLIPFNDNIFEINAPEKGILKISIHDDVSIYRTIEQEVNKGKTTIHWDGCAFNREKLSAKKYIVTAVLVNESGKEYSISFNTPVEYTGQCLQYLLPSYNRVSKANPDEWFIEFKTIQKGTVVFVFKDTTSENNEHFFSINTIGGKINRVSFSELTGKTMLADGNYHVVSYEKTKPEETYEFNLTVQEEAMEEKEVFLTGEILPEEGMTEEEIWQIMQRPSVVVDIDPFKHQKVYSEKNYEGSILGTLHGQTQALKVIRLEDEWAFIGAWNHEEAEYVEGWIPASVLKVINPNPDYGILINKQDQKMDIYYRGKRIDSLEVSTGRPEEKHPEQETAAGSFLTGLHRVDFSMNGKKYDYVIQYDGGNLLHQIPYEWGKDKKDFSSGRSFLGAKASHACVRIQSEPGENGINAYWIWTHVPYHTRVIILDDPLERRPVKERPKVIGDINESKGNASLLFQDVATERDDNRQFYTKEINGHIYGFVICSEEDYVKDPYIVFERMKELQKEECEKIILKCLWSDHNTETHTAVMEAMARKGVKAGADLVVGYGNKSFLGCEWKGNALILYGLGEQKVKRAGKQKKNNTLMAEVIFDTENDTTKPFVILKPDYEETGTDLQLIIDRFINDSIGEGISQICFLQDDQSKQ